MVDGTRPSRTIERRGSGELFSEAVIYAGTLYLAGQVAVDSSGELFDVQIGEVLSRIDALLKDGRSDRSQLLSALIHLASADHLSSLNQAWSAWLPSGSAPARTTVIAALVSPEYLVEITITAASSALDGGENDG